MHSYKIAFPAFLDVSVFVAACASTSFETIDNGDELVLDRDRFFMRQRHRASFLELDVGGETITVQL